MIALTEQKPDAIQIDGKDVQPELVDGKPAITMQQAAAFLGISASALNRKLNNEKIERYQRGVGRERYVLLEDVYRLNSFRKVSDSE